jgi:hypothetical protein
VRVTEDNISMNAKVSDWIPPRDRRARHDVQCVVSNSGDPHSSSRRGSIAYNAANGGSQTAARESDAVIVGCQCGAENIVGESPT